MRTDCSALDRSGLLRCAHGHAVSAGCFSSISIPLCARDDHVFDEERQVVTKECVDAAERLQAWKDTNAAAMKATQ